MLREAINILDRAGIANHHCEARWLLQDAASVSADDFPALLRLECPGNVIENLYSRLHRRCAGEPLQHIIGTVDFFGYELEVGPGVLIPRPETEMLVETALRLYPGTGMICDLCTGSGAIAITLALELKKKPAILAGDISDSALAYARRNRLRHQADNLALFQGDLTQPLRTDCRFALITANPPYIAAEEYPNLPATVRDYDPPSSLIAGGDGLAMIERAAIEARHFLQSRGWLVCEIGETQKLATERILEAAGYDNIEVLPDLSGRPRIAVACKREPVLRHSRDF